jgi:hypothetical protein
MSIKQNGGVFGRNPTFNDVTIDGTLTFDGELDINSDINLPDNKKITFGDNNDLELYHSGSHSIIKETGTGQMRLQASTNVQIWNENATKLAANFNGDTQTSLYYGGNDKLTTAATGISINGNVIMLSGNGIDFSATAGTGTSELLSDYEEGVWTPTYTTSGTDFDSVTYGIQTGSYVKIGELVTVFCAIRTNSLTVGSGTGNVRVGGLPFTVGSTADQWNNATAIRAGFVDATNFELVSCFGTEAVPRDINNNQAALTDLDTGANDNHLTFTLSYRV